MGYLFDQLVGLRRSFASVCAAFPWLFQVACVHKQGAVGRTVTPATHPELLGHGSAVRLGVAFVALHNQSMLGVASSTAQGGVFGACLPQHIERIPVTDTACLLWSFLRIDHLKGLVRWVAAHAFCLSHPFCVCLVAFETRGHIPVFRMVTRVTIEISMLGLIGIHLLGCLLVALGATALQRAIGRYVHRRVGFLVASQARRQVRSVYVIVAGVARRKDLLILRPSCAKDVEAHVALPALYPVFAAFGSYEVVKPRVAQPTLCRPEGLNPCIIHGSGGLFDSRRGPWRIRRHAPADGVRQADDHPRRYEGSCPLNYIRTPVPDTSSLLLRGKRIRDSRSVFFGPTAVNLQHTARQWRRCRFGSIPVMEAGKRHRRYAGCCRRQRPAIQPGG